MSRKRIPSGLDPHSLSRRDLLRRGTLLAPGLIILPNFLLSAARAQAVASFDYYISPSGSDNNPGTQASPWAITALNSKQSTYGGKKVGLLDGTYNVGSMMSNNRDSPALNINGGTATSPTVLAAVNSRSAIINANNGSYGGGNNTCAVLGHKSTSPQQGHITLDGLKLTGGSYQIVEIGNYDNSGPILSGVIIQNCEFTGNDCSTTSAALGGNGAQISLYRNSGTLLRNNYHHGNVGMHGVGSADHFSALYQWQTSGTIVEFCTLINTGNLHGKEGGNQGTTIRNCYIDVSPFTSGQNRSGIQGFDGAPTSGLTQSSTFHNNIIVYSYAAVDVQAELNNGGWTTPLTIYNNTFVAVQSWAIGLDYYEQNAGSRLLRFYNNLYFDNGQSSGGYGYVLANVDAFGLIDYNIYGGHPSWSTVSGGQVTSAGVTRYSSVSAWQASLSGSTGADTHSQSAVVSFSNAGQNALQYKITSGPAFGTGRVGGVASGAPCNIGAWDGTVTQIGAGAVTAAPPTAVPDAPTLSVS